MSREQSEGGDKSNELLDPDGLPLPDDATFQTLRVEASAEAFDEVSWLDLCAMLAWASKLDRRGATNPQLPEGATTAEYALRGVITFLSRSKFLQQTDSIGPLLRLHKGLLDLAAGRVSPIFKPIKKRGGNPGLGIHPVAMGLAARAMEEFVLAGIGRDEAAKKVARALRAGGYRAVAHETVANWRDGCKEGPDGRVSNDVIAEYSKPLPEKCGDTAAKRANALLAVLRHSKTRIGA